MRRPACAPSDNREGSILLPVIVMLMLIATAATAMTLQARTSLREAAVRRDRLVLAAATDGAVRAVALTLARAAAAQAAPPFPVDGTPLACRSGDGRTLAIAVQDEGGRVDLNTAQPALVERVLMRMGIGGGEAAALVKAIVGHRRQNGAIPPVHPRTAPLDRRAGTKTPQEPQDFRSVDELGDLPGVAPTEVERLRPLFTIYNKTAGLDPQVASQAIQAAMPSRELAGPAFADLAAPSTHDTFTITAALGTRTGPRFTRRAVLHLDPESGSLGRFMSWDEEPLPTEWAVEPAQGDACRRIVLALSERD